MNRPHLHSHDVPSPGHMFHCLHIGSLLDKGTVQFLKEHGTALVVSMDGFERQHNLLRSDFWKAAAAALDLARENGLPAGISLVTGPHNAGSLPECLYGLLERFAPASFGVNMQQALYPR